MSLPSSLFDVRRLDRIKRQVMSNEEAQAVVADIEWMEHELGLAQHALDELRGAYEDYYSGDGPERLRRLLNAESLIRNVPKGWDDGRYPHGWKGRAA